MRDFDPHAPPDPRLPVARLPVNRPLGPLSWLAIAALALFVGVATGATDGTDEVDPAEIERDRQVLCSAADQGESRLDVDVDLDLQSLRTAGHRWSSGSRRPPCSRARPPEAPRSILSFAPKLSPPAGRCG